MGDRDLRKAGLKVTLPRVKILQVLERADPHHMSAEDVFRVLQKSGDDVALATVYRVLTQFEQAGLITRHNFEGGHSVFEIAQDSHHDHLVCVRCNHVAEFMDEAIERRQSEIATAAGFQMTDHSLTIYGVCKACSEKLTTELA